MKPIYYNLLGALLISSLNFAQPVMADQASAYEFDGAGLPVRSGDGNCVHTGSWNASMPTCPEPQMVLEEDQGKIVFALDDSEFFGFDQVKLSDPAKSDLNALVSAVKDADMIHGITITGHADQIGPAPYNENLGLTRAESAKNPLVSKGIQAERIQAVNHTKLGDKQKAADKLTEIADDISATTVYLPVLYVKDQINIARNALSQDRPQLETAQSAIESSMDSLLHATVSMHLFPKDTAGGKTSDNSTTATDQAG